MVKIILFLVVVRFGEICVNNIILRSRSRVAARLTALSSLSLSRLLCCLIQLLRNLVERLLRFFGLCLDRVSIRTFERLFQLIDLALDFFF